MAADVAHTFFDGATVFVALAGDWRTHHRLRQTVAAVVGDHGAEVAVGAAIALSTLLNTAESSSDLDAVTSSTIRVFLTNFAGVGDGGECLGFAGFAIACCTVSTRGFYTLTCGVFVDESLDPVGIRVGAEGVGGAYAVVSGSV